MNFKSICSYARCAALSLLVVFAPSLHGVFAATVQTASQPWVANRIAQATNDLAQATLAKDYLVAPFRRGVNYARGDLVEIDGRFYVFVGPWSGGSTADPVASGLAVELSDFRALAEALLAQSFLPLGEEGTNTQSRKTVETAYDRYGVATYTFLPDGFEIRDLDGSTLKLQNTLFRYTDASTGSTKTLDLEEMIQFANVLPMYPQYMDAAHATNPTSPYYVGNYLSANYRTAADTTAEISAAIQQIAPAFTAKAYALDELCTYNGVVYRCKLGYIATASSVTPNSDTTHWEAKKVSELFLPLTGGMMTGDLTITEPHALWLHHLNSSAFGGDYFRFRSIDDSTEQPYDVMRREDLAGLAPLASPAFTGTPTAPTPTAGDNSMKVATTAFVQAAISGISVTPLSGQTFDFATTQGVMDALKTLIETLGGTVVNAPSATIPQGE